MTYHSEYGQDRWLVENVFGHARNGTFVEAGALDGVFHSNTLFFERELDWRGVLVEPILELYSAAVDNRPLAKVYDFALGRDDCFDAFEVSKTTVGWSGFSRIAHARRATTERKLVTVPVVPLAYVLREAGVGSVDYLSLDVEGAEFEVLSVYPFEEIPILVIGVEDNDGDNEPLRELLIARGYTHLARVGVDEFWGVK